MLELNTQLQPTCTSSEFLEAFGVAVYTTDANGVLTSYNEAAVELWGRRPEIGKDRWCGSWRLFRPDGAPLQHEECPMGVALRENRPVRGEEAIAERPDGSRVWFMPFPTPLRDASGALRGAVNVLVDVTRQRRAERELEERERDLRDFFDNSTIAMHWVGPDGTILRANQSELDLLGYDEDEYIGHNIAEFHVDNERLGNLLARLHRGEVIRDYEAQMRCCDGAIRDVLIDSSVLWRDGRFVHTRCITRDVTDRRRAERALSEALVADRKSVV